MKSASDNCAAANDSRAHFSACDGWLALGLFALALTLRLIFLFHAGDRSWPHSIYFEGDAPLFAEWAAALDGGAQFEAGLPLHSPATPYLLHWLGPGSVDAAGRPRTRDFTAMKAGWCVVSAATAGLLFLAARRLGRRAAVVAALLHALSFGSYVVATSLNNECIYSFVLVALVGATARWLAAPNCRLTLALGVLHGAATLLRAEHPLLLAAFAAAMALRGFRVRPAAAAPLWSAAAPLGWMSAAFILVCLPWSILSHSRIVEFDTKVPGAAADAPSPGEWTPDARAFIESLPAFARADNARYLADSFARVGRRRITGEDARAVLLEQFHYIPEPISPWILVSCQGPLAFALANDPTGDGGFSKAGLDARFGGDPRLQLSLPSHLRLVNHGYAAGWDAIRRDPRAWLGLLGRKLERFAAGACLGFGATNWPVGREGPRWAVDLLAPSPAAHPYWCGALAALFAAGIAVAIRRRVAGLWLLVVLYKVIVAALFFGYARQAVSIAPAFFVMIALAIDAGFGLLPRRKWLNRAGWLALGVGGLAAIAADLGTAIAPREMRVLGPAHLAPRWSAGAFEAAGAIELRFAPPREARGHPSPTRQRGRGGDAGER